MRVEIFVARDLRVNHNFNENFIACAFPARLLYFFLEDKTFIVWDIEKTHKLNSQHTRAFRLIIYTLSAEDKSFLNAFTWLNGYACS